MERREIMRFALYYLAWMNVADGIFSFIGLQLHVIEEGNWLMNELYEQSPYLFLFCKLSFSILLYIFLLYSIPITNKLVKTLTYSAAVLYTVVFIVHGVWISSLHPFQ
jgi:hypothetical protein